MLRICPSATLSWFSYTTIATAARLACHREPHVLSPRPSPPARQHASSHTPSVPPYVSSIPSVDALCYPTPSRWQTPSSTPSPSCERRATCTAPPLLSPLRFQSTVRHNPISPDFFTDGISSSSPAYPPVASSLASPPSLRHISKRFPPHHPARCTGTPAHQLVCVRCAALWMCIPRLA